jgi:hypothetical protein
MDAAAEIRKEKSTDFGSVTVRLLTHGLTGDSSSCYFSFSGDWVIRKENSVTPTTSWANYSTGMFNPSASLVVARVSVVSNLGWNCPDPDPCRAETRVDDEKVRNQ